MAFIAQCEQLLISINSSKIILGQWKTCKAQFGVSSPAGMTLFPSFGIPGCALHEDLQLWALLADGDSAAGTWSWACSDPRHLFLRAWSTSPAGNSCWEFLGIPAFLLGIPGNSGSSGSLLPGGLGPAWLSGIVLALGIGGSLNPPKPNYSVTQLSSFTWGKAFVKYLTNLQMSVWHRDITKLFWWDQPCPFQHKGLENGLKRQNFGQAGCLCPLLRNLVAKESSPAVLDCCFIVILLLFYQELGAVYFNKPIPNKWFDVSQTLNWVQNIDGTFQSIPFLNFYSLTLFFSLWLLFLTSLLPLPWIFSFVERAPESHCW